MEPQRPIVVLRPLGSPAALALAGLTAAALVTSGLALGWIPKSETRHVGLILLAFPFPLQLSASIVAFLARDGVAGTAFGVLAGAWLSEALVELTSVPGARSGALGLLMLAAAGLLLAAAASMALGKLLPAAAVSLVAVRFALHGAYELGAAAGLEKAAGWVGVAVVVLAWYLVASLSAEDAQDRTLLPLLRRGRGRAALEAPLDAQTSGIAHEAGVRSQL